MTPAGKRIALLTFGVLALAAAGGYTATHLALKHGVHLNTYGNEVGGSFRLMDSTTGTMTDQTFRNRWMLVLFGATHCAEDACAPALRNMSAELDQVEGGRHNAVIIFVSLDPDRDDAERLRQYGESIGPRIVSGTAAPFALVELAKEYHAPIEKVPDSEWTYTMRMSPQFVVMGPEVSYKGMIDARADSAHMAEDLRRIMHSQNGE